jgi:hypothetical protein
MGIRAGGDPLSAVVPDLEQLAANPRNYLTEGPLLFGPRRFYGLAAFFAVPGIIILILWGVAPQETERLALGIALLIGASVWFFFSLASAGHSLFLGPDGVEIRYRDTTVFCPWDLFDVDGTPWTPEQDTPSSGLALPVSAVAVPMVVWRRGMVELARGMAVRAPQAWFLSPGELIMPGRYELRGADLGKLLLLLGTRLGGRVSVRDLREVDRPATGPPQADKEGFYTVTLTRFQLPPCCVACAREAETILILTATSGYSIWMDVMPGRPGGHVLNLEVPCCRRCYAALLGRLHRTMVWWTITLGVAGLVSGLLAPEEARLLATCLGGVIGALLGLLFGTIQGQPDPLVLRNYSPSTGTVRVRFRNPEVEKLYRQWQEKRS